MADGRDPRQLCDTCPDGHHSQHFRHCLCSTIEKRKRDVQHAKDLQDTADAQLLAPASQQSGRGRLTPRRLIEYGSSARSSDRSYEAPPSVNKGAMPAYLRSDVIGHTRHCAPATWASFPLLLPPKKPKLSIADDAPSTDKRRCVRRRNATPVGTAGPRPGYLRGIDGFVSSFSRIDRCITTHPSQ